MTCHPELYVSTPRWELFRKTYLCDTLSFTPVQVSVLPNWRVTHTDLDNRCIMPAIWHDDPTIYYFRYHYSTSIVSGRRMIRSAAVVISTHLW